MTEKLENLPPKTQRRAIADQAQPVAGMRNATEGISSPKIMY